jgi:Cft2 family RNA processing exonuclease
LKLTFLGGAESIGASSLLIEIDGRRWVADCGVRVRGSGAERLPDLGLLETGGAPTAVLVTHAHLDHIGALPILHQRYPLAAVYATAPTIALTRIQLLDSLRIMEEEATIDGELPLYSAATVESLLGRMVPVTPLRPFRPEPDGPEVTFFPSGHILGACSIGIEAREGRLFVSGDVSVDNQRTIPGMRPPRFRADVAVFESTYGKRLHAARAAEEDRLAETVAAAVAAGGKVLIPAFAIGRAQEVILILLRAQLLERIPVFPIHVDGLVRACSEVYSSFPWFLQSTLRKRIEKHGDPFFGVLDTVRPVRSRAERAAIIAGPPAAIVSSSGMLSGGPSPYYARALLGEERNLIAITGYQDEESPGRRLLDAAEGRAETITIEGAEIRPAARIASYGLSGHASGSQIAALVRALDPADVLLVHGDAAARREVADILVRERAGRVHLPRHGEPVEPAGRLRRSAGHPPAGSGARRLRATGIGKGVPGAEPSAEDLAALAAHVVETYREGASFTADELHAIWHGAPPANDGEALPFEEALRRSASFSPHPVRLFHFHAAPWEPAGGEAAVERPVLDASSLSARLEKAFPPGTGFLRASYQPGFPHMVLVFAFPTVARARYAAEIDSVFEGSGWTHEIHPIPNIAALEREVRARVPEAGLLARNVSARLEGMRCTLHISRALGPAEEPAWAAAAAAIRDATGFEVEIAPVKATPAARVARDTEGRLEINLSYQAIRTAFAGERHTPARVGLKPAAPGREPHIEAAFISPEVGARYRGKLDLLGEEIGWRIEVSAVPNQHAILQAARDALKEIPLRKGPSFVPAARRVAVELAARPDPAAWESAAAEVRERTGYELWAEPRGRT